jgi:hypothetical protein
VRRALALILLVLPLAACGGDVTSIDPIAQAADKTANVAGAHFFMSAKIVAEGETVEFRGPGEIADHGKKLHMQMTMPAEILGIEGAPNRDVTLEFIGANRTFYFRGGPFTDLAGRKWVTVPDTEDVFDLGQNDPSKMLEYLRATSEIDERGTEPVRGVETTHYEARIQLDKVADKVSPDAARALEQMTRGAGIEEVPLQVWVDRDSLVRRITMNWRPKGGSFLMKTELFDFGDVQIDAPAPSETTPLSKLLGGG